VVRNEMPPFLGIWRVYILSNRWMKSYILLHICCFVWSFSCFIIISIFCEVVSGHKTPDMAYVIVVI